MSSSLVTITTFFPTLGAIIIMLYSIIQVRRGKSREEIRPHYRWIALGVSMITFFLSLGFLLGFDTTKSGPQLVTKVLWIEELGVHYYIGVDGISLWLVLLTTFLVPGAVMASWTFTKRVHELMIFILILETGMIGVFVSFDLFLFYLFWEIVLIPMYFLIGIYGGENRIYAAIKFVVYTVVGSLLMLVAIIALYYLNTQATGVTTFDLVEITRNISEGKLVIARNFQWWMWLAFALAFFIKVPLWPFHTWLPDAHTEAPTGASVLLAGILLKMGTYGLMRFNLPLFPEVSYQAAPWVMLLAVIGIIYGALVAMVQPDMKKLVAYSSVSHLGFIVLGIFAFTDKSMQGALYQMLNHGISTGALFLCVGILYDRRHTRDIEEYGGIANRMPRYSTMFLITAMSSLGLPLLNGFVGEFLILLGTFSSTVPYAKVFAVIGGMGVVLSAVYLLWMLQRVLFGQITKHENEELDHLSLRERYALLPPVAMAVLMGVTPMLFLRASYNSVDNVRAIVEAQASRAAK
jgi:NADH-quinone oxidoreductase subunit M